MSVNPGWAGQKFLVQTLDKIRRLKTLAREQNSRALIQVDGGVNLQTAPAAVAAGADILVSGSALFAAPDMGGFVRQLRG
jgi:ribulose-phosphate 3-epimerase